MKKIFSILCILLFSISMLPSPIFAAGTLSISTPFPGISVKPGNKTEVPIHLNNNGSGSVTASLSVENLPSGWSSYFEGSGDVIHKVYVEGQDRQIVDLNIDIPATAKDGKQPITIIAQSDDGSSSSYTIELTIQNKVDNASKLVAQYPELKGPGSASFSYRVDLYNNQNEDQSYSLNAEVPSGWDVKISPSMENKQIASISVEPDKSTGLDIEITPGPGVKAGTYTIPVSASSAEETLKAELTAIITGTYDMTLTTPDGRLSFDAKSGKKKSVQLQIQNNGSSDLKNVTLSSWQPDEWTVEFDPKEIDVIPAGESKEVTAYVTPANQSIAGDYVVKLTAKTPEAQSDAEFRVAVKTSTLWGMVGVLIICILVVGLYQIFKKYGRR